jgi:murein DD-endopeptidase MepM/ murein hydrolase activator NlpD
MRHGPTPAAHPPSHTADRAPARPGVPGGRPAPGRGMLRLAAGALAATLLPGCRPATELGEAVETCAGYAAWDASDYRLPYAPGTAHRVSQANCAPPGDGHRGVDRYAYDWAMPIGTPVVASRAGTVLHVEASHADGEVAATGKDNYVAVRHADGSVGVYAHLTRGGAAVDSGQAMRAGDPLGRSGNTGNTNNFPHLHLSVHACDPVARGSAACPTVPLTFRNTRPNPAGLASDGWYTAEE